MKEVVKNVVGSDDKQRKKKYDYSLKTKKERSDFIEEKTSFMFDVPPYRLMGYSNKKREQDTKWDRLPRMIDNYTTYLLTASDVESSRKTEYSFYTSNREESRRKTNKILFRDSKPFDGDIRREDEDLLNPCDTYHDNASTYGSITDYDFEDVDSQTLKYLIVKGCISKADYKKILSMSCDILLNSKDEDFKEMVEQIIFNCKMTANDDKDISILKEFIQGMTLREISETTGVSFATVRNRIDGMLGWVTQ